MNNERDNFHDWARHKPDNSKFTPLSRSQLARARARVRSHGRMPWSRFTSAVLIGAVIVCVIKLLLKH